MVCSVEVKKKVSNLSGFIVVVIGRVKDKANLPLPWSLYSARAYVSIA